MNTAKIDHRLSVDQIPWFDLVFLNFKGYYRWIISTPQALKTKND